MLSLPIFRRSAYPDGVLVRPAGGLRSLQLQDRELRVLEPQHRAACLLHPRQPRRSLRPRRTLLP